MRSLIKVLTDSYITDSTVAVIEAIIDRIRRRVIKESETEWQNWYFK